MQNRSWATEECAVARSLEQVGKWWTILILRNVFLGMTRFSELELSLGIAPTTLTRRLKRMVQDQLLQHSGDKYGLTEKGEEFLPVILALVAWGNRWTPGGKAVVPVWSASLREVSPLVIDSKSGRALRPGLVSMASGPDASETMRDWLTPARRLGEKGTSKKRETELRSTRKRQA